MHPWVVPEDRYGMFDLSVVEKLIRSRNVANVRRVAVIALENTHNVCGGKVLPLEYLKRVFTFLYDVIRVYGVTVPDCDPCRFERWRTSTA